MYETLMKMLEQAKDIFDTFEYFWVDHKSKFFVTVWPPGGIIITFAENWNFELKFFLVNTVRKKITSRVFWINFLYKNGDNMLKN